MLLVPDSKFGDKVLIQLRTQVVDTALQAVIKEWPSNASNW